MKSYKNIIILAIILVSISVFFTAQNANFDELLLKAGFYDEKITVVNTADVHGHIVYEDNEGGYYALQDLSAIMGLPLVKYFVDDSRNKNKNTLLLDSGDMFHGTNEANIEEGKGVVDVVNLMGYDAMVPGNHDFNFGFERLMEIESQLNFPMLSANVYKDGEPAFQEYKIVELGGIRIGMFGLTTEVSLSYINSKDDNGIRIEEPAKAAKRVMEKLKGKVDAVILLSHIGFDNDERIAREVDGIDLILCGHYHDLFKSPKKVNNTYLVEAGGWTTHVGIAQMYFKDGKVRKVDWSLKTTKDKSKIDKNIEAVAQKYHAAALEKTKEVVGKTKEKLNGMRFEVRSKETNLANLLADAMRESGKADITLMNGGGIRESITEGEISLYKIEKTLPFSNSLVTIELKGEKIYDAIERGLRVYPSAAGGAFLQVSGISYVFDGSKPAGERLISVTKDGSPLDKEKYYKVATNDYLYNGGDGYEELKDAKIISVGGLLKDVLAEYIRSKGEISPKEDGRIKVINERYKQ